MTTYLHTNNFILIDFELKASLRSEITTPVPYNNRSYGLLVYFTPVILHGDSGRNQHSGVVRLNTESKFESQKIGLDVGFVALNFACQISVCATTPENSKAQRVINETEE